MKCRLFRDLLDEYMDDEINETRREAMEEHAEKCADCRTLLQDRKRLFHKLTSVVEPDWTINLADSVMNEIRTHPLPQAANPLRKPLIYAAITAVIISGLLMIFGLSTLPDSVSPVDVMKLMAGSIEMPPGLRASVQELGAFLSACWVILRVMIQLVITIVSIVLFRIPISIPLIILASVAGIGIWRLRKKQRSGIFHMFL